MQALFRILMLVFLITGLAFSAAPVRAQQFFPQLPPDLTPQWTPIPGAPGVQHAPNTNADLFRYGQSYYYQHDGKWYQGRNMAGPWQRVQDVPQSFRRIEAPYFKQPPGWAKGNKTGWKGDNMPPGQRKKYEGDQHGQMNKHEGAQHAYQGQYIRREGGQQAYQGQNNKHDGGQHGKKDKHDGGQHGQKDKHDR